MVPASVTFTPKRLCLAWGISSVSKHFAFLFSWLSNLCLLNEVQYFWICLVSFWRVVRSNIAHEQWCTATLQGSNQPVYKQHRAHLASVETELNHHSDFYVHMVCRIYTEMCCQFPRQLTADLDGMLVVLLELAARVYPAPGQGSQQVIMQPDSSLTDVVSSKSF